MLCQQLRAPTPSRRHAAPGWRVEAPTLHCSRCDQSTGKAWQHPTAPAAGTHARCHRHPHTLQLQHRPRRSRCAPEALPGAFLGEAVGAAAASSMAMGADSSSSSSGGSSTQLLLTCLLMFVAAAGSGLLPSALVANQQLSGSLTVAGAGLLLGSALCIILPEGFQAAQAAGGDLPEWAAALALLSGFWVMLALDAVSHGLSGSISGAGAGQQHTYKPCQHDSDAGDEAERLLAGSPYAAQTPALQQQQQQELVGVASLRGANVPNSSSTDSHHVVLHTQADHSSMRDMPAAGTSAQRKTQPGISSTSSSHTGATQQAPAAKGAAGGDAASGLVPRWRHWLQDPTAQTLLGLLVHAVSDGLAVGAASLSEVPSINLGVATAMVVHKGPVAVGLAVFLRAAGWSASQVTRGILMFAAASPLAALATYGSMARLPSVTHNIPLAVLFSGGTVLYAATMHILPSATHASSHHHGGKGSGTAILDKRRQLLILTASMMVPLLLATAFHHDHGTTHHDANDDDHHHHQHHHHD